MLKTKAPAIGLLAALICIAKFPQRVFHGYLWAEDGVIFIKESAESAVVALWTPYAGYLHTVPRVIVGAWSLLAEPARFPHGFAWTCIAIYFLVAVSLFRLSRRHFPAGIVGDAASAAVALLPFLIPQSGEIYINVTNLQWFLAPVLAFLLIDMCAGLDSVARRTGIFLFSATGPFGVMMLPLAGALWYFRSQTRLAAALPYLAACVLQIASYAATNKAPPSAPLSGYSLLRDFLYGTIGEVFTPLSPLTFSRHPKFFACLFCLALFAAFFSRVSTVRIALPLLAVAFALWLVGVSRQGTPGQLIQWDGYGARYLFLPELCVAYALVWSASTAGGIVGRAVAVGMLCLLPLKSDDRPQQHTDVTSVSDDGGNAVIHYPPGWTVVLPTKSGLSR